MALKGLAGPGGTAFVRGALFAVAAFIRLANLSATPFWMDERWSLAETQGIDRRTLAEEREFPSSALRQPTGLLTVIRASARVDQPAYIALLTPWTRAFGVSEVSLRVPSAISGALTVPLLFILGRRLLDRSAAVAASLLVTVSPLHVGLSREARTYAVTLALLVGSLVAITAVDSGRRWTRALWSGLLVGAVGVFHLLAAAMMLPLALWWVARGTEGRHTAVLLSGIAIAWLAAVPIGIWPSVITAHRDTGIALQNATLQERDWARPATAFNLAAGVAHGATRLLGMEPSRFGLRTRHVAGATILLLGLVVIGTHGLDRAWTALLVGGALTPFLVSIGLAFWYGHVVSLEARYLIWALPSFTLLLARGASSLGPRWGALVIVLALGLSVASLVRPPPDTGDAVQLRHRTVAAVMRCYREGDLVVVSNAEEARLFVGFGGHPARLSIGVPSSAPPPRRWVIAGAQACARGIAEDTCGLSMCPPSP